MNDAAYRKLARVLIHHDTLKPRILLEVPWRAVVMPARKGAWVELKGRVWVPEPLARPAAPNPKKEPTK